MALQTFAPAVNPSRDGGIGANTTARSLTAQFGDGYSQRAGDGLNAIKKKVALRWEVLTQTDADAIEAFFEARLGYEAFLYTVPYTTSELKWIVTSWDRTVSQSDTHGLTATFEQVFDL